MLQIVYNEHAWDGPTIGTIIAAISIVVSLSSFLDIQSSSLAHQNKVPSLHALLRCPARLPLWLHSPTVLGIPPLPIPPIPSFVGGRNSPIRNLVQNERSSYVRLKPPRSGAHSSQLLISYYSVHYSSSSTSPRFKTTSKPTTGAR